MCTPNVVRLASVVLLVASAAACGGFAGKTERAFCDAVEAGDAGTARTLLATEGFNVWARNARGDCQPLRVVFDAATPRHPEFMAMALALLEVPDVAGTTWVIPNSHRGGNTSTGSPLISAVANQNLPLVRAILAAGADARDTQARAALTNAVFQGPPEAVHAIVEAGAAPEWALSTAINERKLDLVAYLEKRGARERNPDILVAARTGNLAQLDAAIAARADLEVRDATGLTPIMRAASFEHPEVIARLARAGADVDHMTGGDDYHEGMTALHLAAQRTSDRTIKALLAAGANVEARKSEGWPTPLLWAVTQGSSVGVHALVEGGANGHTFKSGDKSALSYAIDKGRLGMVRDLLKAGARPNERIGEGWQPPLHAALPHCGKLADGSGRDDDFHVDLLRALVDAGADRTAKDAAGLTPVEAVAKRMAEATHPYYEYCFRQKLEYLQSLR